MRAIAFGIIIALFLVVAIVAAQSAEPAGVISLQGKLLDVDGYPVRDGIYAFNLSIWNAESGGTMVWGPEAKDVTVKDGIFQTTIGEVLSLTGVDFNQRLWLEVEIEGETLAPRSELAYSAWAFAANRLLPTSWTVNVIAETSPAGNFTTTAVGGFGVYGRGTTGVFGFGDAQGGAFYSTGPIGVSAVSTASGGSAGYFRNSAPGSFGIKAEGAYAVSGRAYGSGLTAGGEFIATSDPESIGVYAEHPADGLAGLFEGNVNITGNVSVIAETSPAGNFTTTAVGGFGVYGRGTTGVFGFGDAQGGWFYSSDIGVLAESTASGGFAGLFKNLAPGGYGIHARGAYAVTGRAYGSGLTAGGNFLATSDPESIGVYAEHPGDGLAGLFEGNVKITGVLDGGCLNYEVADAAVASDDLTGLCMDGDGCDIRIAEYTSDVVEHVASGYFWQLAGVDNWRSNYISTESTSTFRRFGSNGDTLDADIIGTALCIVWDDYTGIENEPWKFSFSAGTGVFCRFKICD